MKRDQPSKGRRRANLAIQIASGAFALLILAAWTAGRLISDRTLPTQFLSWLPTALIAPAVFLAACVATRQSRPLARLVMLLVAATPLLWLLIIDWRVQHFLTRGPNTPQSGEIVIWHWNTTPLATLARWRTSHNVLNHEPTPNILIITNPPPSRAWQQLHGGPPLSHRRRGNRFGVYADAPITRLQAFSLEIPDLPGTSPPDPGAAMLVEIDLRESIGRRIVILAVDFPSDPRLARNEIVARTHDALERVREAAHPAWANPDIVLGDCNTPRHANSLRRLVGPQMTHAFDQGGFGFNATWPGPQPFLHIDHIWTSPAFPVRRYDVIQQPHYRHHPQAVIIRPRDP
ncbi:MAG: hypothetical protein EA378_02110 [Phycisphaerales bacterium]|nr:MAG: hypothetical protein EA378_02110 [Phycisphaerales bacterium]